MVVSMRESSNFNLGHQVEKVWKGLSRLLVRLYVAELCADTSNR